MIALVANITRGFSSVFYGIILLLHFAFYGLALWGWFKLESTSHVLIKLPLYFLTVNAAILVAWIRYLRGNRMVMWAPSSR